MKVFAFLLASLFVFQAAIPALCMTNCVMEAGADSSCFFAEEEDVCCAEETPVSCCSMEKENVCCAAEAAGSCTLSETDKAGDENKTAIPCNNCCIPCCSAPLCCFYFQEITALNLSLSPVQLSGTLPSNNGIPHSGYLTECFQPPESIS